MPNKAVPNQVLAIIKSGQVKADEVKWSGIEDWLKDQTGRVSKEDVLAFLDANDVQIEEVTKGDDRLTPNPTRFAQYQLPGGNQLPGTAIHIASRNRLLPEGLKAEKVIVLAF